MKYDTVIFDLDGTLLDTLEDLTNSVNYALEQYGFSLRSLEEIRQFVGNGVKVLMDRAVPEGTSARVTKLCLETYRNHYSANLQNKTRPYDGIIPLLKALKEKGLKLAIVSNKYDSAVKELCSKYYGEYIEIAIGDSIEREKKPAPDGVYAAMQLLNSQKISTVYIGDSEVDVLTAHNAGLPCVGVTWGFRGRSVLEAVGADHIIDTPSELMDFLNS